MKDNCLEPEEFEKPIKKQKLDSGRTQIRTASGRPILDFDAM